MAADTRKDPTWRDVPLCIHRDQRRWRQALVSWVCNRPQDAEFEAMGCCHTRNRQRFQIDCRRARQGKESPLCFNGIRNGPIANHERHGRTSKLLDERGIAIERASDRNNSLRDQQMTRP